MADFWWRRAPGQHEFRALDAALQRADRRPTVFLQGEAVDWIIDAIARAGRFDARRDRVDWWVCIGSWRRRASSSCLDELPAPLQAASLPQWIDRTLPQRRDAPDGHEVLFVVDRAPRGPCDRIETLEPVLAAAALERDVAVLLQGPGTGHLVGPGAEAWDQLVDHELAPFFVLDASPGSSTGRERGQAVDAAQADRLRREAGRMVDL